MYFLFGQLRPIWAIARIARYINRPSDVLFTNYYSHHLRLQQKGLQKVVKVTFLMPSKDATAVPGLPNLSEHPTLRRLFSVDDNVDEMSRLLRVPNDSLLPPDLEGDGDGDTTSVTSKDSITLRERQDAINEAHPFGIRIWKPALYKKIRSVERTADADIHETGIKNITFWVHTSNIMWALLFGIPISIFCVVCSAICVVTGLFSPSARGYARVFVILARYFVWPFGEVVYLVDDENYQEEDINEGTSLTEFQRWVERSRNKLFFSSQQPLSPSVSAQPSYGALDAQLDPPPLDPNLDTVVRYFGRGHWNVGRVLFYIIFYLVFQPVLSLIALTNWLFVFTIPMSKVITGLLDHMRRHPLALGIKPVYYAHQKNNILLCTFRSSGWHYYKYTVDGTNVILINLTSLVIFTITDFFLLHWTSEFGVFILCLASIIPLAYFIGQAVASISAQTSMGLGAVINAFFSTIVEVYLYCVALRQDKGLLVEGSLIGSLIGGILLLPGLSMISGGFVRKTQRYNPKSAGVSSTMLIFSIIVMFCPSILYFLYGGFDVVCNDPEDSKRCHFHLPPLRFDSLYTSVIKPMSIVCVSVLFFEYVIVLWFTLKTHASLIWQMASKGETLTQVQSNSELQNSAPVHIEGGGHDVPNWSRTKSTTILLVATILYATIAEILVDCVDAVLQAYPQVNQKFLGITVFALVPNTTEFLNAVAFALQGNIALSMEIGSAYALQVCLLQIPALVVFSVVFMQNTVTSIRDQMLSLVFPQWDVFACMISVFLFTYLYAEGKSNYFKGSVLVLFYVVVVVGFYFQGLIDDGMISNI